MERGLQSAGPFVSRHGPAPFGRPVGSTPLRDESRAPIRGGRPYFVMELVHGIKITEYCDQNALPTRDRLTLFIQVCQAIQHAHQKGIIHRDIKPSNILVTLHDGVPVPKVIDFGIAKAIHQDLTEKTVFTQFQQFVGTPAYISPEQAEMSGLDVDTRADIYSLGVLLYELLVGQTPFDPREMMKDGLDALRQIIREKEPLKPSTRLKTLPVVEVTTTAQRRQTDPLRLAHQLRGDLDWIVMKCLEKDRTRRYETANGLAMDLRRHLGCEPVLARPPSAAYRLQKTWQRHRGAFLAGALVAVALVAGTGVSWWQAIQAGQSRVAAEAAGRAEAVQRRAAQAALQQELAERRRAEASEHVARELLYVASLNLIRQAWEENNLGRIRQLLEQTAGSASCGFEWYYWQRQAHLDRKTFWGHTARLWSAAFSPDGRRIVTGSLDLSARVWEATTGQELLSLRGHQAEVYAAAFSPDGQQIVTGSADGTVRVWTAAPPSEVAVWQQERRDVSNRLSAVRARPMWMAGWGPFETTPPPGLITRWLGLAPIDIPAGDTATALDREHLPDEAHVQPREGERIQANGKELTWEPLEQAGALLDFNALVGRASSPDSVAYVVCYLVSASPRSDLVFKVVSDDVCKVYLNGRPIHRSGLDRNYILAEETVDGVELKAGTNTLVFKVLNHTERWFGSLRVLAPGGQALPDLRVTLEPGAAR